MESDSPIKLIPPKLTLEAAKIISSIKKVSVLDKSKRPLIKLTCLPTISSLLLVTVQIMQQPNLGILYNGKGISGKDQFQL